MIDERLIEGVTAWLQDSDMPPPDARMSAGRAMAGVSRTKQLGRWFPPARLVRRARPAPALAPRDLVPPSTPRTTEGIRSMFSATRVVVVMLVFALVGGGLLVGRALLPDGVEPGPAIASPAPSVEPTVEPTPQPQAKPTADSTFAAIGVIAELPEGSDPIELVPAPPHRPGAVFIDRASKAVLHVEDDGELRVLMQKDSDDPSRAMEAAPTTVDISGDHLVVIDADGGLHLWADWRDSGRVQAPVGDRAAPPGLASVDPTDLFQATPADDSEFDLHTVDATDGSLSIAEAHYDREAFGLVLAPPAERIDRDGPPAMELLAAGPLFVATADGVERYLDGALDADWSLEAPIGPAPDYRRLSATGETEDGQLWLYDEAGRRFVAFDKAAGSYLGSWAPKDHPLDDVRGLFVLADEDGMAESVTWVTPSAVVRAALERSTALQPNVTPAPDSKGRLTTGDRPAAKKGAFVWSGGGVELKADRLVLRVTDHPVVRAPAVPSVTGDMQANGAQLEIEWTEGGIEQRLYLVFVADDTHWWIDWIWVYDGEKDGRWIEFQNLEGLTRTPLGESLVGDLRLESTNADREQYDEPGSAVLRIDGLKLSAMVPGTRPAPLTDCRPLVDGDFEITREYGWDSEDDTWSTSYGSGILRGPGEPLQGMKSKGMTPKQVEDVLKDLGVCYRFSHEWQSWQELSDGSRRVKYFQDFRCTAPKSGTVIGTTAGAGYPAEDGTAVLYVIVEEKGTRDWPAPPPAGTDCPTQ